jgi:ParB-like chromosome segregation protein Spo0J
MTIRSDHDINNIDWVERHTIKPNSYNPNQMSQETLDLLAKSISVDGWTQPIVVNEETREIVDGEHRWRVSGMLGHLSVPVHWVHMTPEEMRIATIRHNRARGLMDEELIGNILADLDTEIGLTAAADDLGMTEEYAAELYDMAMADPGPAVEHAPKQRVDRKQEYEDNPDPNPTHEVALAKRVYILKESDVWIVDRALGANPAQKLMEMCQRELDNG